MTEQRVSQNDSFGLRGASYFFANGLRSPFKQLPTDFQENPDPRVKFWEKGGKITAETGILIASIAGMLVPFAIAMIGSTLIQK